MKAHQPFAQRLGKQSDEIAGLIPKVGRLGELSTRIRYPRDESSH